MKRVKKQIAKEGKIGKYDERNENCDVVRVGKVPKRLEELKEDNFLEAFLHPVTKQEFLSTYYQ